MRSFSPGAKTSLSELSCALTPRCMPLPLYNALSLALAKGVHNET
jgi:hypothetical protein